MNNAAVRIAAVTFALAACQQSQPEAVQPGQPAAVALDPAPGDAVSSAAAEPGAAPGVIRDVRVNPSSGTVEITFTAQPNSFATVVIGPTAPMAFPLSAFAAGESPLRSVLIIDPETQVAGYTVRSTTASYRLDTARDEPVEDSTNGPSTLRPGTTYHFVISVPVRPPQPGEDTENLVVGAQHAGTFTTRR